MKIFVFAIGGTGARVLRSLTMLLASGVPINPDIEFIPIIIDMDAVNGDTIRTKNVIDKYTSIRAKSYSENPAKGFFCSRMNNLASYKATSYKGEQIQNSFMLEFGNIEQTFYKYMKVDQLNYENEQLLTALFDSSPEPKSENESSATELFLNLSKGFKGNPNIGSIIFNDLVNSKEYKYFEDICTENDKVLIISSIFGGTGSAGFPQLVKNLRKSDKGAVKNVQIGALVVMPYFLIARKTKSAIDSNNFNSKTKAALTYYGAELDGQVNDTYYIGCNETGDAYDNHEGGKEQKNLAHLIELISAMGVLHYAKNAKKHDQGNELSYKNYGFHYYEYGARRETNDYDFRYFFPLSQKEIFLPLASLTFFAKFYTDTLKDSGAMKAAFARNLGLNNNLLITDEFYAELTSFFHDDFLGWLEELKTNKPHFVPFNLKEDFKKLIVGQEYNLKSSYFIDTMSVLEKKYESISSPKERFMRMAYETCKKAIDEKIVSLPSGDNL